MAFPSDPEEENNGSILSPAFAESSLSDGKIPAVILLLL